MANTKTRRYLDELKQMPIKSFNKILQGLNDLDILHATADDMPVRISRVFIELDEKKVSLYWKPSNYGGGQPYWLCPWCDRVCAKLFERYKGDYCCRYCTGFHYRVHSLSKCDRLNKAISKLEYKVTARKPKGRGLGTKTKRQLRLEKIALEEERDAILMESMLKVMAKTAPQGWG